MTAAKNSVCLWFNGGIAEAAKFYSETFPDTQVDHTEAAPADTPGPSEGEPLTVAMSIMGVPTVLLNGGREFPQSEAFSFQVATETQEETDRYWNAIVGNGGTESQCGWCKDQWGVSWQITPRQLTQALGNPDKQAAKRAMEAMFTMKKIDIATIEAALRGNA